MKSMQKYFFAFIPPEPFLSQSTQIKEWIKEQFGIKYALKSPPHITVKMPFTYNEAKEEQLINHVAAFLENQNPFRVEISGIGTFGNRVIFHQILPNPSLNDFQASLKLFCKRELHLTDELSDRNFHPHMTLAFKDLKASKFDAVLKFCREKQFSAVFIAEELTILKRIDGRWKAMHNLPFKKKV